MEYGSNCNFYRTMLCYRGAVYAVDVCVSVRRFVCLSQASTVPKRLNAGSQKPRRTIVFWSQDKISAKF